MRTKLKTYFPGEFNPASKYDLHVAKWLVGKTLDVLEVIIVVGKDKEGELPQDVKLEIWEIYLNDNVGAPIKIVKSKNLSPLSYIYKEQENDPTEAFSIALDEEVANDDRFKQHFDIFPNYEVMIVPTHVKEDLKSIAQEGDIKKFNSLLPTEVSKEDKKKILDLVKGSELDPVDEVLTREYWKNSVNNLLEKAGIK